MTKSKKKSSRIIDEFGDKREPFVTNEEYMANNLIENVYEINAKNRRIKNILSKALVAGAGVLLVFSLSSGPISLIKTGTIDDKVTSLQSPAFKTRYDQLGADVISNYYAQRKPNVNTFSSAAWNNPENGLSGSSSSNNNQLRDPNDTTSGGGSSSSTGSISNTSSSPVNITNISLVSGEQVPFILSEEDKKTMGDYWKNFTDPVQENLTYAGYFEGNVYLFAVSLAIPDKNDETKIPFLINAPTMTVASKWKELDVKTGTVPPNNEIYSESTDKVSSTTLEAIDNWASAYAEDDKNALKVITGDKDPNTVYNGLGDFSLVGRTELVWAYNVYPDGKIIEDPFTVMRVNFQMRYKNDISGNTGNSSVKNEFAPLQTMDILVSGAYSGIPSVVAWTSAGNWSNLKSYMNAIQVEQEGTQNEPETTESSTTRNTNSPISTTGTNTSGTSKSGNSTSTNTSNVPGLQSNTDSTNTVSKDNR